MNGVPEPRSPDGPSIVTPAGSVTHRVITLSEDLAWDAALAGVDYSFGHSRAAARAFSVSTGHETLLLSCEAPQFRTVCVLAMRSYQGRADVFTPPGFSGFATAGTVSGFDSVWLDIGRAQGWVCAYIQEHPLLRSPFGAPAEQPVRTAYVLDLSRSDEDLLAGMSQSRRRQLRETGATGIAIARSSSPPLAFLQRQSGSFFARRAAEPLAIPTSEGWAAIAGSPDVIAMEAVADGETVAVSLFGGRGAVADYLYNISTEAGQRYSALLIWHAIPILRELGHRRLNLGGGIRANDSIAEFKRRFGPDEYPIVTRRCIFDVDAYYHLAEQSGATGTDHYFPVYHRRG